MEMPRGASASMDERAQNPQKLQVKDLDGLALARHGVSNDNARYKRICLLCVMSIGTESGRDSPARATDQVEFEQPLNEGLNLSSGNVSGRQQ